MIEEGFVFNKISHDIIEKYLSSDALRGIEALLLACTHYPLIEKEINEYYKNSVEVVNSADLVAQYLRQTLVKNQLFSDGTNAEDRFFVSDYTDSFERSTKLFFGEKIKLEKYKLWP
jgi:glutamate racemase